MESTIPTNVAHYEDLLVNLCDQCSNSFFSESELKSHIETEHQRKKGLCCNNQFESNTTMLSHRFDIHRIKSKASKKNGFHCGVCPLVFDSYNAVKIHREVAHRKCNQCSQCFGSETALKSHTEIDHKSEVEVDANEETRRKFLDAYSKALKQTNDVKQAVRQAIDQVLMKERISKLKEILGKCTTP